MCNLFRPEKSFLSGSKQFLITKHLDKFWGAFVCVYDQNNDTIKVIQQKKSNWKSV